MKYLTRSCSGRDTAINTIGQSFKFTVSNSAHFSKRSEDIPWHNGHTRTDITEFGPIPTRFWFTLAQSYREVAIMNQDFVAIEPKIGKIVLILPITALSVFRAPTELGFRSLIEHCKF